MGFQKVKTEKDTWIYEYGEGKQIPMEAIKTFFQPIFIAVLIYFAFNFGQYAAYDYVKLAAYLGTPHCDSYGQCLSYTLEHQGNNIVWVAKNTTVPKNTTINPYVPQPQVNLSTNTTQTPLSSNPELCYNSDKVLTPCAKK